MADLRKYEACECMPRDGFLSPLANDGDIVRFYDDLKMIDTYMYDESTRSRQGRMREFIISDKEYFKRKLNGS